MFLLPVFFSWYLLTTLQFQNHISMSMSHYNARTFPVHCIFRHLFLFFGSQHKIVSESYAFSTYRCAHRLSPRLFSIRKGPIKGWSQSPISSDHSNMTAVPLLSLVNGRDIQELRRLVANHSVFVGGATQTVPLDQGGHQEVQVIFLILIHCLRQSIILDPERGAPSTSKCSPPPRLLEDQRGKGMFRMKKRFAPKIVEFGLLIFTLCISSASVPSLRFIKRAMEPSIPSTSASYHPKADPFIPCPEFSSLFDYNDKYCWSLLAMSFTIHQWTYMKNKVAFPLSCVNLCPSGRWLLISFDVDWKRIS